MTEELLAISNSFTDSMRAINESIMEQKNINALLVFKIESLEVRIRKLETLVEALSGGKEISVMCETRDNLETALRATTAQLNSIERKNKPNSYYEELAQMEQALQSALDEHLHTCQECQGLTK